MIKNDLQLQKLVADSRLLDQISKQLRTPRHLVPQKIVEMKAQLDDLRTKLAILRQK